MSYLSPASIIDACQFDEYDLDIGTSGLCGTFALALHDVLADRGIASEIVFLGPGTEDGKPRFVRGKQSFEHLIWRHALVKVGGTLFDIYGEAKPEHAIENYCWGDPPPHEAAFTPASREEAMIVLEATNHSLCTDRYRKWFSDLQAASRRVIGMAAA